MLKKSLDHCLQAFASSEDGAALVEYAVALIVVTLVGGVIFALSGDIATIIGISASAF